MEYTVRKALFTDIERILEIEKEFINSWTFNQFLEEMNKKFTRFLVYESEGSIRGYVCAWVIADEMEITSFAVEKNSSRRGIGTCLLNELTNHDAPPGTSAVFLEVRSRNRPAVKFYLKNGFTETGRCKNYYPDDDAILMEKKLR